jgi:hypothetical protein
MKNIEITATASVENGHTTLDDGGAYPFLRVSYDMTKSCLFFLILVHMKDKVVP